MEFYANAQDTSLLHLALGLAGDLGLARAPEDQIIPTSTESVADAPTMKVVRGINVRVVHTHADRRAMLGIFYLTSNIWSFLRRAEPLEYTDHIDKLCKDLKQAPEYSSDQLLVEIVDLQRITLQAGFMSSKSTYLNRHETLNTPLAMLIASQHKEMDRLVANIPQNIQYNHIIRSHYSIAVIRLHEPVIFMKTSNAPDGPLVRSQFLWTCLQTTKSMLTSILSFPGEIFSRSLLSMTAHIGFAHLTLTRLLFLNDPCWDAAMARKFVDYPGLVEQLAVYFETTEERPRGGARRAAQAQTPAQAGDKKPPLSRTEKMRLARNWYLSKLPPDEMPVSGAFCQPTPSYDGSLGVDGLSAHHWQMLFDSAFVP
ncbi:hypothetical protein KJ359_007136 [Pestalotiopsis sp. 9143b]|nr:hypothetical protein KJ359_007136 [Pestalotiopsis sp. 9143b]